MSFFKKMTPRRVRPHSKACKIQELQFSNNKFIITSLAFGVKFLEIQFNGDLNPNLLYAPSYFMQRAEVTFFMVTRIPIYFTRLPTSCAHLLYPRDG